MRKILLNLILKRLMMVIVLLLLSYSAFAQTVTGTVSTSEGETLPGVTISIKGTLEGVISDLNGNYTIEVNSPEDVLVFSYTGMITFEVLVGDQTRINVELKSSESELNEVVVIGYGKVRKVDKTGSIASFLSKDMQQPVLTATQSIQGKTTGIQVISSGEPGTTPTIRIRGMGTILGGRNPLYVVDGIITGRIDNINNADILTMDILKDASSLAIYGNRGANGVIIITTKKGHAKKPQIVYNGNFGFKDVSKKVKMANSSEFIDYSNDAFIASYPNGRFIKPAAYSTDWFDEITQKGNFTDHSLSLSGATEKVNYFFSAGYYAEKGILKGNDFNRITIRSNIDYNITDKLKFGHRVGVAIINRNMKPLSAFTNAYKQSPLVPARYETGRYGLPIDEFGLYNNVGNPVVQLDLNNDKAKDYSLQGAITGEYEFTDFLKFNTSFTIETAYNKHRNYIPNREYWIAADTIRQISDYPASDPINTLQIERNNNYWWTWDNYFTFDKTFASVNKITATLGTSAGRGRPYERFYQSGINVPENSNFWNLGNAESITTVPGDAHIMSPEQNLMSFFGRAFYSYDSKYMITATFRADGSGQFQKDSRWGYFPSVGIGWVLSEESSLSNSSTINFLKLRGSWGHLGNQNIPLNILTVTTGLEYPFGLGQVTQPGTTVTEGLDPDVSWEVTEEFDIGLEFNLFDEHLSGEIDYYNRLNKNALLHVAAPDILGISNRPITHAAKIRNQGIEAALKWSANINEFRYYIGGNITYNKNVLEEITNEFAIAQTGGNIDNGQVSKRLEEGEPLGSFWLYELESISATGEFVFRDKNGDGNIDDEDRSFFGSYQPKLYYGISLGFNYKKWDFSVDTYGNYGNKVYNGKKAQRFGGENIESSIVVDRWTVSNPSSTEPAPFNAVPLSSTYYLESGSFFRVNNITLGYSLKTIKFINSLRVYISAQNPIIIQDFSGFTPELQGDGDPIGTEGVELNAYPSLRSYLIGININF